MRKILILALFLAFSFGKDIEIFVQGIHCPLCTSVVRKSLLKVDGVKSARVELKTQTAFVSADDFLDEKILLEAIKNVGYPGVIKGLK